jgi:cardiolipin synthase C
VKNVYERSSIGFVCALALGLILAGCSKLPERPDMAQGQAASAADSGILHQLTQEVASLFDEPDAAMLVSRAQQAMELRLAMIDSATVSLDAQYFTWADDSSGNLLLDRFLRAADRGVRVRLLVDDLYLLSNSSLSGPDAVLAAIDAHPNVELRIYNPGRYRSGTLGIAGNFAGSFREFNSRMHNKLFIADGLLAMVGGRNLADEYYGLKEDYNFLDLDALVTGEVVPLMSSSFDLYWNADAAYPAAGLSPETGQEELDALRDELAEILQSYADKLVSYPAEPINWSQFLADALSRMHGIDATFLQDDPGVEGDETYRLVDMIAEFDLPEDREVTIVTPYLIPLEGALKELKESVEGGLEVTLLTASLASGDHTAVNAHYKKYRQGLLEAGANLYEFHHQPGPQLRGQADTAPITSGFVALHPKVSITDRRTCFVGSLNLDPRAMVLNTENGLVIESEGFCAELDDLVRLYLQPENSWHVTLDDAGKLQWTSYEGTVHKQPARSSSQRMSDFFFRMLPIEKLL